MASPTVAVRPVAEPVFTLEDLREQGLFANARVGSCIHARRFGTIAVVVSEDDILTVFDDGASVWMSWTALAPLGYVVAAS
jgi:hypothetical protein